MRRFILGLAIAFFAATALLAGIASAQQQSKGGKPTSGYCNNKVKECMDTKRASQPALRAAWERCMRGERLC